VSRPGHTGEGIEVREAGGEPGAASRAMPRIDALLP